MVIVSIVVIVYLLRRNRNKKQIWNNQSFTPSTQKNTMNSPQNTGSCSNCGTPKGMGNFCQNCGK